MLCIWGIDHAIGCNGCPVGDIDIMIIIRTVYCNGGACAVVDRANESMGIGGNRAVACNCICRGITIEIDPIATTHGHCGICRNGAVVDGPVCL